MNTSSGVRAAVGGGLATALATSAVPVAVHLFAAAADPNWFNMIFMAALMTVLAAVTAASGASISALLREVATAAAVLRHRGLRGWATLAMMATGTSGWGLFVLSAHHAGTVTASVLYQLWTLSMVSVLAVRDGPAARRLDRVTVVLMAAAAAATAVMVATQTPPGGGSGLWWVGVTAGAAGGMLSGAGMAATIVVGHEIVARRCATRSAAATLDVNGAVVVLAAPLMVACACAVLLNTGLAAAGASGWLSGTETATAAGLGILGAAGSIASRFAHVRQLRAGDRRCDGSGPGVRDLVAGVGRRRDRERCGVRCRGGGAGDPQYHHPDPRQHNSANCDQPHVAAASVIGERHTNCEPVTPCGQRRDVACRTSAGGCAWQAQRRRERFLVSDQRRPARESLLLSVAGKRPWIRRNRHR